MEPLGRRGMGGMLFALSEQRRLPDRLTMLWPTLPTLWLGEPTLPSASCAPRSDGELGTIFSEKDDYLASLAEIAPSFMLLVPAVYEPGITGSFKYAYSRNLPWSRSLRNAAARLGLADHEVTLVS